MGNLSSCVSAPPASKEAGVAFIDEYDVESRKWRRVPVVDEDEIEVAPPRLPAVRKKEKSRGFVFLFVMAAVLLAAAVPFFSGTSGAPPVVRIAKAEPRSAYVSAAARAGVRRTTILGATDFRTILAEVNEPLSLDFVFVDEGRQETTAKLVYYDTGRDLLARCSRPRSKACALAFKRPPRGAGLRRWSFPWSLFSRRGGGTKAHQNRRP